MPRIEDERARMTGPLTYPPGIVIESKIDLPPGYEPPVDNGKWMSAEVCFELVVFAIELVGNLLDHL